ncbi:MAG: hypothetical protein N2037_02410 [Acidimicrobiales bacterium]|nr:hypothetical protein [Acidimicrobiales bacterium]
MQPTDTQVERSLAALRERQSAAGRAIQHREISALDLPAGLIEQLAAEPAVRADRLAQARHRLSAGEHPDAQTLATKMVGRLVCDRLR